MKVGDRVRITKSVIVYHSPEHRNQPYDVQGHEGEVIGIVTEWQGRPVSANLPVYVQFDKKFKAHFREDEIEALE
ncbi:ferredoxin-thioredoxin reductase variable chain [Laspinema olomoucense]|uniref:Ferredoxin-thioredoxin reductase variable chain n=1 Tax=Laspinema olomoucense D3b TaxID=2953688 RepID=A0ABT2N7F2_9CYAN|nr:MULTISPECIES: ferredoxin-thioredoxin reductase variable chain [unclassified Laspinema]MCT7975055.1 ferredoxin-thioredoxin reductase variable chain [Laspinema sp. D3d]MCT7978610.1 ferredoxin-thioredoxin reductase variable chain [Laspinema sp. D3b]MCT7987157.1 ferredoxin-thioredoxin reductase variable chain [Laspinema sp. D3a]MCT7992270.1 ferredoxin-thioredoxin reductase variable chain [Laspinema sp. D3c]